MNLDVYTPSGMNNSLVCVCVCYLIYSVYFFTFICFLFLLSSCTAILIRDIICINPEREKKQANSLTY